MHYIIEGRSEFELTSNLDKENTITFDVPNSGCKDPVLQLGPKDEIRVRGKLVENYQEVVDALRWFVTYGINNPRL